MIVRRLWSHIAAAGLLFAVVATAKGQEASPSTTVRPQPGPTNAAASVPLTVTAPDKDLPASTGNSVKPIDPLDELVAEAIRVTSLRRLTAGVHTPWQVVHGILAQRWDLKLQRPGETDISGIEWITAGQYFDGMPLWEATPYGGRGHPYTRPYAFEGHPTQFMGYMTMANIPFEYEVQTPTKIITIRDIVNDAKMQVHEGVEITWTLWTLAHYEDTDARWFNAAGEPWSVERLMKLQIDEPVTSGACGGCHGLYALAYARNMFISAHGLKGTRGLRGVWFEADHKIKRYIEEARILQNTDGSFSAAHFKGALHSDDFATRITTSGHQLEWLMIALSQKQLQEEWVRRGIAAVANDLIKNKHVKSDCGPLFHGMHALVVYRQRTVPGYLVPQFNSQIKLADRVSTKEKLQAATKSKAPESKAPESLGKKDEPRRPVEKTTQAPLPLKPDSIMSIPVMPLDRPSLR